MTEPGTGPVFWRALARALEVVIIRLPHGLQETFLTRIIGRYVNKVPATQGLRFLLKLEADLYPLTGAKAVEHDGGTHPKHRHTGYHDFFVSRINAKEKVLDIGCGSGMLAWEMADRAGAVVTGIDTNPSNIQNAEQKFHHPRVTYRVGDAKTDFGNGKFDVVVLSNVLEHMTERTETLRAIAANVAPSRFLIRVPLFERDWRVPLKKELGLEWRLDPTHETEYTLESFADELAAAGLAITHREVRWGEIWAEARPVD